MNIEESKISASQGEKDMEISVIRQKQHQIPRQDLRYRSFYVPKDEREKLKEFAAAHDMSLNEFVNLSISLGKKRVDRRRGRLYLNQSVVFEP